LKVKIWTVKAVSRLSMTNGFDEPSWGLQRRSGDSEAAIGAAFPRTGRRIAALSRTGTLRARTMV